MRKVLKYIFLGLAILVLFTVALTIDVSYDYLSKFSQSTGILTKQLVNEISQGISNPFNKKYLTVLLLGTDFRQDTQNMMTDTIILLIVNTETGNYSLFSVPRDLWLEDLGLKVNALYEKGLQEKSDNPVSELTSRLNTVFGITVDFTTVIGMDDIKQLIDYLGGIEVDVERSFTDERYPKDDGSYQTMTIEFKQGKQTVDGERALQFIRSRKSYDPVEGTDDARQIRQKKIIMAIKNKLFVSKRMYLNVYQTSALYKLIMDNVEFYPKMEIKSITSMWKIVKKIGSGKQTEAGLSWQIDSPDRILQGGYEKKYGNWVMIPIDGDWEKIKEYYQSKLP